MQEIDNNYYDYCKKNEKLVNKYIKFYTRVQTSLIIIKQEKTAFV